ncbi:MAG: DUF308 domain-containing protein [Clostridia bacterium]|nr:DUF308 domain-containing protein [Clostridia bacterium]
MKKLLSSKRGFTEIATVLLLVAFGIAILLKPAAIVTFSATLVLGLLVLIGIIWLIRYLRMPAEEAAQTYYLAGSLAILTVGTVFYFNQGLFDAVLPRLWGMVEIIGAFLLLQMSVDFLRLHIDRWWIMLIGAGISMILGILAVVIPDFITPHLSVFIGISLIIEGIIHLASIVLLYQAEQKKAEAPALERNEDTPAQTSEPERKEDAPAQMPGQERKEDSPAETPEQERKEEIPSETPEWEKEAEAPADFQIPPA